jgi:Skp family chaperone for outer membrane proteins
MATKALVTSLLIALAVLAGCGQSAADKAKANVCSARDDIGKQVQTLQGITLSSATTSKISDSLKAIQADLDKISQNAGKLSDQFKSDVKTANEQFTSSVKDTASNLGKTVSVADAKTQLQNAFNQLASSYKSSFGQLKC